MSERGYVDDPTIPDSSVLWRRIPPRHFVRDENTGRMRPSSAAFEDHPNGSPMSVILGDVLLASGRFAEDALAGHADFALAAFAAGLARQFGQGVMREPLDDEPAHAIVFGEKPKRVGRMLAKAAEWVIPPPDESQDR